MKTNTAATNRSTLVLKSLFIVLVPLAANVSAAPSAEQQARLLHLLKHDCGSCHGMTMKGGLGPALLPEAIASKPKELLVQTILEGRNGTAMPPWKALLKRDEVVWLVETLSKGLPNE